MTRYAAFIIVLILSISLFAPQATKAGEDDDEHTYHSESIVITSYNIYETEFVWNIAYMPYGYTLDLDEMDCIAYVTTNLTIKSECATTWEEDRGQYFFKVKLNAPQMCREDTILFKPWVYGYSTFTGAHDKIYGDVEWTPSFCKSLWLPAITR